MTLRKAAQQALAALETPIHEQSFGQRQDVLAALRAALEREQEQEQVAWASKRGLARIKDFDATVYPDGVFDDAVALYANPPRRDWQGLTDNEIDLITNAQWALSSDRPMYAGHRAYARAVEAKLKEKNHD